MSDSLLTPVVRSKAGRIPKKGVNAWIMPQENEPKGTTYSDPTSCFQSLIRNGVYRSIDLLSICWCHTVPTSSTTVPKGKGDHYTISMNDIQQYTEWLIRDSRKTNPAIKVLVMLFYGADEITALFPKGEPSLEVQYAQNVLSFLKTYGLDGFDVDWEGAIEGNTSASQFKQTFQAIRQAFDEEEKKTGKHYYLVISPSGNGNLDTDTVNTCFDWVTLQNYWYVNPSNFPGIDLNLFQFGAQFEEGNGIWNTAQTAYQGYAAGPNPPGSGPYQLVTQWRLNSTNFQYEQAQQMILYQLVYGLPGNTFDDTPIITTAGNPLITNLVIQAGEVLNAIQVTNAATTAMNNGSYVLPQHGGTSDSPFPVTLAAGDTVVAVSGYTGVWFGWECVLQITLTTAKGTTYGPFGSMRNATSSQAFQYQAPAGQSIVAFKGSTVTVPLAGGGETAIIASLGVSCATLPTA